MSQELLSHAEGPVHRLTLNRPDRRNALTPTLARELAEELDRLEEAGSAQVILLTRRGRAFLRRTRPALAAWPGRDARYGRASSTA